MAYAFCDTPYQGFRYIFEVGYCEMCKGTIIGNADTTNIIFMAKECVFCTSQEIKDRTIMQTELVRVFPTNIPI